MPITYTTLEEMVGDFLEEEGTKPASDWVRYIQALRQKGIKWAEMQMLRHLPDHDCRNLIYTEGIATDASGVIITTELAPAGEEKFFGVVDIYNTSLTPDTHFVEIPFSQLKFKDNRNYDYGHYWYYAASTHTGVGEVRQIQLKASVDADYKSVTDSNLFMTYKVMPSSYQGNFGAVKVPFERNEELAAKGAAGYVFKAEGDPRAENLLQEFYQEIGISDDSTRRS